VYPTKFLPGRKPRRIPESITSSILNRKPSQVPNRKKSKDPNAVSMSREPRTPCPKLCFQVSRDSPGRRGETYRKSSSIKLTIQAISILKENPAKSQQTETTNTHTHKRSTAQRQLDREVCVSKSAAMFQNNYEQISRLFEGQLGQWSTYKMVNGFKTCRTGAHTHKRSTAQRQLDREVCVPKSAAMFEGQMEQWSTYKMVNGFRTCRTGDGVEREASTILWWRIGRMGWSQVPFGSLRRRRLQHTEIVRMGTFLVWMGTLMVRCKLRM
jgi:hypothetical protein